MNTLVYYNAYYSFLPWLMVEEEGFNLKPFNPALIVGLTKLGGAAKLSTSVATLGMLLMIIKTCLISFKI